MLVLFWNCKYGTEGRRYAHDHRSWQIARLNDSLVRTSRGWEGAPHVSVGLRAVLNEELAIGDSTNVVVNTSIDKATHAPHLNHRLNQAL